MVRSNPAATLLFWAMILVGGSSLAAGFWLPAWLEMRQAQAAERARLQLRDELREHVIALDRRREHLEHDPAYIDRLARREFGEDAADRESIAVSIVGPPVPTSAPATVVEPAWVTTLEHLAQTHPIVRLYVEPDARWKIQALSAGLVLAAILFLARRPRLAEPAGDSDETAQPGEERPAQVS